MKKLGFLNVLGNLLQAMLKFICRLRCCRNFHSVMAEPFEYPTRVKTAGGITLGLCLTNSLAVKAI